MLERLRRVEGVVQLLDEPRYPGSISLADLGGTSLATLATPLDPEALVRLGSALAGAVAGMHRRGVLHRDITPANVVISRDGTPCLVGFGLATSLAEIRPEFTHYTEIVGTLGYLAPEQTGRTGRSVDQRADLYALGATLYELATGAPPFGSGDPLQLTHDHLALVPEPPAEVNAAVPGRLSEIILHLLEKEPDNRYQTADGALHDLQRLRDGRPDPAAAPVRIGRGDIPLRLLPPSQLVGRDAEVAALQEAFDDALAGRCRAVLVGGAPGVGKTALIDELRPVVTRSGGWFVAGKFDQYRRDLESSGVYRAFRTLGRLLLAEPEDELAEVRDRISAALGPNAGLMAAVVSEYAAVRRAHASRARIVAAADQTRRRIERDLHDGAQQRLVSLAIQARMAQVTASPESAELAARLDAIATEASTAIGELRELARGIHPAALTEGGLGPALRVLARRCPLPVRLDVRVEGRLPEQVEIATYFAVAEMLTNTAKHPQATAVSVDVDLDAEVLRVRVSDDGRGGADIGGGSGLIGLKDRVEALGGRVWVQSAPAAGTTVRAELPLRRPAAI